MRGDDAAVCRTKTALVAALIAPAVGFAPLITSPQARADQFVPGLFASCLAGYGVRVSDVNAAAAMGQQVLADITPTSPSGADTVEIAKLRQQYGLYDTTARGLPLCVLCQPTVTSRMELNARLLARAQIPSVRRSLGVVTM